MVSIDWVCDLRSLLSSSPVRLYMRSQGMVVVGEGTWGGSYALPTLAFSFPPFPWAIGHWLSAGSWSVEAPPRFEIYGSGYCSVQPGNESLVFLKSYGLRRTIGIWHDDHATSEHVQKASALLLLVLIEVGPKTTLIKEYHITPRLAEKWQLTMNHPISKILYKLVMCRNTLTKKET